VLLTGLVLSAGCNNDSRLKGNDPLAGGGPAIPLRSEAPAATTTSTPRGGVPPIPSPSSATSNAALAGGAFQPLDSTRDPSRDLRIGNGDPVPTAGGVRGPNEGTNATLNQPQPIPERTPQGQLTSDPKTKPLSPIQPVSGPAGASADALLALLQARGVSWYRLETSAETGEIKFTCSVPNATNPNIRRMYEAKARDGRTAMLAILTQMDQERH
jgi:hypothetical protein